VTVGIGMVRGLSLAVCMLLGSSVYVRSLSCHDLKAIYRINACCGSSTGTISDVYPSCIPAQVQLANYSQWQQEEGFWIGDYTLLGADGEPSTSTSWNYPYNHYKGFITGNVRGHRYRQRNVFMYPPQVTSKCPFPNSTGAQDGSSPVGLGVCGVNGNMKVFEADQSAMACSLNPERGGDLEGPYGTLSYTYTELVGKQNSLLYQVWLTIAALNYYEGSVLSNPYKRCTGGPVWDCGYTEDRLMQSQLTTLTQLANGEWRRTRTAQGFDAFGTVGAPTYASFYRERKVDSNTFWTEFNQTISKYSILASDTCAWKSAETGGTISSGYQPGFSSCKAHLDQSWEL